MSRSDPVSVQSPSTPSRNRNLRVIVVGGGLAGIASSLALARSGIAVTLVEAKRRLGGRVGSFTDPVSGDAIDYCQHVGMGCCTNLRQLIDWLGQTDQWQIHKQLHFYGPDGTYRKLGALPWLPAPLHLAKWLWSWPGLTLADRVCIARGMRELDRLKLSDELDCVSAKSWLIEKRQTARSIDRFWSTVIVSALGEELGRVSLLAVAKVFQDGFLRHRDAFHLLVPQEPLSSLFGSKAESVLRSLNVQVESSATVRHFTCFDGRCCGVKLADGRELNGTAVILAIPWHRYSSIVGAPLWKELEMVVTSASRIQSSPISGVHSWWDRAWLDTQHAVLVGRLCQWVFPKPATVEQPASPEHYYQIVISASRNLAEYLPLVERDIDPSHFASGSLRQPTSLSSQRLRDAIHADLAAVFPKAASAKLLRVKAVTDPLAVFSVEPGIEELRPKCDSVGHGLWLAGDWTKTGWPATMESAAHSGFNAAEKVMESFGCPQNIVASPLD